MQKVTLKERWRYFFDNVMAKGTSALVTSLGLLSLVVLVVFTSLIWITGIAPTKENGEPQNAAEIAWAALMRTLDAGTMGGDTGSWAYLFAMFGVTAAGVFIISTFIGVLTSGIDERMQLLRKGRSKVIEKDHTVILFWTSKAFPLISELVEANANNPRACVAILGEADKVEMEEAIRVRVPDTRTTRVVCRTGSPIDLHDLEMMGIHEARSIIIPSPEVDDPDIEVIKALLAITNNPLRKTEPYHIVAEIRDPKNMDAARLAGKDEAQLILAGDLISRITAQTCRQSGLSIVYTELLDFGGDEIYFHEEPRLVGLHFSESLFAYEDSAVIGIRKNDGRVLLNPPMDTLVEEGNQLIVISEDDDTIRLPKKRDYSIDQTAIVPGKNLLQKPERALVLGWNWRVPTILTELEKYVCAGSEALVVTERTDAKIALDELTATSKNQSVSLFTGETTDRRTLENLAVQTFHHVILVCDDQMKPSQADARSLVTLLHLRDMAEKGGWNISIVSEMLDARNRELAEVTRADDFIVSEKLVSLMLSQVSENKELKAVFADLFSPEGSEIYLKPVERYVTTGVPLSFHTVMLSAARKNEVAIGYRKTAMAKAAEHSYGVVVNPVKSEKVTFAPEDKIVVLAES